MALDTRPLRIHTLCHRAYIKTRYKIMKRWQDKWIHPSLHGARPGHETAEPFIELSIEQDLAKCRGINLHTHLMDAVKHFDRYMHPWCGEVCRAAGLDPGFVNVMEDMWATQQIYFKIAGTYGKPQTPHNGITQGCTFSLVITNLNVTIWLRVLEAVIYDIKGGGFVDDKSIRHTNPDTSLLALQLSDDYDEATGHERNMAKSPAFTTDHKVRAKWRAKKCTKKGKKVCKLWTPIAAKYLGIKFQTTKQKCGLVANEAMKKYMSALLRINSLPVKRGMKEMLCKVSAMTRLGHAAIGSVPTERSRVGARSLLMKTLWGKSRALRSTEIVLVVHINAEEIDPHFGMMTRTILDASRILKKRPALKVGIKEVLETWDLTEIRKNPGYINQVVLALRALGMTITPQLTVEGDGRAPFTLDTCEKNWLKTRLKEAVNATILTGLAERSEKAHNDAEIKDKATGRQDMQGIDP